MIKQGTDFDHPQRSWAQRVGAILWPSFFAACVASAVFFALIDPLELQAMIFPESELPRELGYTIGFFLFWIATFSSSLFTWLLLRPGSRYNHNLPPQ
jgi:hypothetical protein